MRRQSLQRVKNPEWAILKRLPPHFFVVGRLTASFSPGSMTGVRTVSRNKSVISWACEPPHYTFCFQRFCFSRNTPRVSAKRVPQFPRQNRGCFPLFSLLLEAIRIDHETICFIEHLFPSGTRSNLRADNPRVCRVFP